MEIKLGTQLCVDQAYKCFIPDIRYYYLGPWNKKFAQFVFFFEKNRYQRVAYVGLDRTEFEALISPTLEILRICDDQLHRPIWMSSCHDTNFAELEDTRRGKKVKDHESRIAAKIEKLGHALIDEKMILAADKPGTALNSYAVDASVHPYRFESEFFSYILHGKDPWALMPRWHVNGTWDREQKNKKFGRKALARHYCFNFPLTKSIRDRIVSFARANKNRFRTFVDFHAELLRREFRCIAINHPTGRKYFSSQSEPFPSKNQAYRAAVEELTSEEYAVLFGKTKRRRAKKQYNDGNFTEQFSCNLEAIEWDAFVINEVMRSFISEQPTTKVVVARITCSTTTCVVGIGFSVGGERREAYRAALYSMIAPRDYLEKIYGLDEGSLQSWVSGGMSAFTTSDRGAAAWDLMIKDIEAEFPLQTIAPSQEPLSKALSESSHPRTPDASLDGIYLETVLTVAGVIKRELLRAARENESGSIGNRPSDAIVAEMHAMGLPASPDGLWEYNRRKGRNAGHSDMSHATAIRTFWEPITVILCRDGVLHCESPYGSDQFRNSGVMELLATGQRTELQAYALSCAVGYLHVEVAGKLIEVTRVHRMRLPKEDYAQTREDLELSAKDRAVLRSEQRMLSVASHVAYNQQSVDQIGEPLNGGRTRHGRKPHSRKTATGEIAAIRAHTKARSI